MDAWMSGCLNQSRYCRQHQLKLNQFIYWRKKFSPAPESSVSLVEVPLAKIFHPQKYSSSAALKVAVGDKYKVEVNPGFDPVTFKEIIVTLGQL